MALLSCPSGPQPNWCPRTTDDVLPTVLGLLPPGPVWDGAKVEGTVQNTYWRAYASVLGYTYGRLCDFVDEFFCHTVKESLDQWIEEYGLDDPCDPYGHNLCVKVAAQGGTTCDYFVQMAALSGWTITCDTPDINDPVAGCFEVGCTPLGPTPQYVGIGSRIGYGQRGSCVYGEVVQHPDPGKWENGHTAGSLCVVPGSNLGQGPDTDESCCFIVGYYNFDAPGVVTSSDFCQGMGTTINFDCPRTGIEPDSTPCTSTVGQTRNLDDNLNYSDWGHAFVWEVTVDIGASQAAQAATAPPPNPDETVSAAGNFMVGLPLFSTDGSSPGGTPLCFDNTVGAVPTFALCFLERIKPAHTTINVKVIQPS
jgi:uncharacterized protein YmfQ (DUF2313 family)